MRRASIRKPRVAARSADLATAVLNDGGGAVSTLRAADPALTGCRAVTNVSAAPDASQRATGA